MQTEPRLLDLFCGAGGCSVGYARAGFSVFGVDNDPKPLSRYPYTCQRGDALAYLIEYGAVFDVIHASPPCPAHSTITPDKSAHEDLVGVTREHLIARGGPYVIENVPGAPLENPITLCGASFGLGATCRDGQYRQLKRHRLFESNIPLMSTPCACDSSSKVGVYGDGGGGQSKRPSGGGGYKAYPEEAKAAMGIGWMGRRDLSNAIPPAYTEFIGKQLLSQVRS